MINVIEDSILILKAQTLACTNFEHELNRVSLRALYTQCKDVSSWVSFVGRPIVMCVCHTIGTSSTLPPPRPYAVRTGGEHT